jgi:hypothetical protein
VAVDIEGLRKIIAAATQPGPWSTHKVETEYSVLDANGFWVAECGPAPHDAALIAVSRVALPAALDELEVARAALKRAQTALYDAMHAGHLSREYHDSVIVEIERALGDKEPPKAAAPFEPMLPDRSVP